MPSFYDRNGRGIPERWVAMMKESMVTAMTRFTSQRMLTEYTNLAYVPLGGNQPFLRK